MKRRDWEKSRKDRLEGQREQESLKGIVRLYKRMDLI